MARVAVVTGGTRGIGRAIAVGLKDAGYNGEKIVILQPTDVAIVAPLGPVTAQALRNIGMNIDVQSMDWQTMVLRRANSGPIEQVFFTSTGLRAFAGLRNDPFFFDFEGFTALIATFATPGQNGDLVSAFRLSGNQARRDSFVGRNASAIVFEIDLDAVAPKAAGGARPKLRAWATTGRSWVFTSSCRAVSCRWPELSPSPSWRRPCRGRG